MGLLKLQIFLGVLEIPDIFGVEIKVDPTYEVCISRTLMYLVAVLCCLYFGCVNLLFLLFLLFVSSVSSLSVRSVPNRCTLALFLVCRVVWLGFDAQENLTLLHLNNKGADQPAESDQRLITFAIVNLTPCKVSIFDSPLLSILKARSLKFQNCNCNFEALEGF